MARHPVSWLDPHLGAQELKNYHAARERAATIALAVRSLARIKPGLRAELRAAILTAPPFPSTGTRRPCPPSLGRAARPSSASSGARNSTQEPPNHG